MKVIVINQDPISVTEEQGIKLMKSMAAGVEVLIIDGEMIKASAIMGIRKDNDPDYLAQPLLMWGESSIKTERRENREPAGPGYEKYLLAKQKLLKS